MKLELIALLLAFVLLFGCAQGQAKTKGPDGKPETPGAAGPAGPGTPNPSGGTTSGGNGGAGTPGGSGTVEAFTVLDSFSASDLAVTDPDPGAEFAFDEKQLQ